METTKKENKVECNYELKGNHKENKSLFSLVKMEQINISLSSSSLKIRLLLDHLEFHRDDDIAYGLLLSAVEELEHSVACSVDYENQLSELRNN